MQKSEKTKREKTPEVTLSKTYLEREYAQLGKARRGSSKFIFRDKANPDVFVRASKSDLVFVRYVYDRERRQGTTEVLGKYSEFRNGGDYETPALKEWIKEIRKPKPAPEPEPAPVSPYDTINGYFENKYFKSRDFKAKPSWKNQQATLRRHILSEIGDRHPETIERAELYRLQSKIADKVSEYTANRAFTYFHAGISWLTEKAPNFDKINFPRIKSLDEPESPRQPLPEIQLRALWHAAGQLSDTRRGAIVKLLILTGQRRAAICGMRWSELTIQTNTKQVWLNVPAERSKMKEPYKIPLAPEALAILEPFKDDTDVIFPTEKGHCILDGHTKVRLERHMKPFLKEHGAELAPWCLHNVRKNFRNLLTDLKVDPYTAEALIGHAVPFVTESEKAYNTVASPAHLKVSAIKAVTPRILAICEGTKKEFKSYLQSRPEVPYTDHISNAA